MEKLPLILNYKQVSWLETHGGRNKNDLRRDEKGMYVLMADGFGEMVPVYLPGEKGYKKVEND